MPVRGFQYSKCDSSTNGNEISPQPIRDADIKYDDSALSRLRLEANMIGGVINPANIANACCNPLVIARKSGRSSSNA